jgi:hypothetical protein
MLSLTVTDYSSVKKGNTSTKPQDIQSYVITQGSWTVRVTRTVATIAGKYYPEIFLIACMSPLYLVVKFPLVFVVCLAVGGFACCCSCISIEYV